jgi:molecular chaperone DnaK
MYKAGQTAPGTEADATAGAPTEAPKDEGVIDAEYVDVDHK